MPSPRAKYCLRLPDGQYLAGIASPTGTMELRSPALMRTADRSHSLPLTLAAALAHAKRIGGTVHYRNV